MRVACAGAFCGIYMEGQRQRDTKSNKKLVGGDLHWLQWMRFGAWVAAHAVGADDGFGFCVVLGACVLLGRERLCCVRALAARCLAPTGGRRRGGGRRRARRGACPGQQQRQRRHRTFRGRVSVCVCVRFFEGVPIHACFFGKGGLVVLRLLYLCSRCLLAAGTGTRAESLGTGAGREARAFEGKPVSARRGLGGVGLWMRFADGLSGRTVESTTLGGASLLATRPWRRRWAGSSVGAGFPRRRRHGRWLARLWCEIHQSDTVAKRTFFSLVGKRRA